MGTTDFWPTPSTPQIWPPLTGHLKFVTGDYVGDGYHTHILTQPFYGSLDFVQDNLSEPVPEETFAHSHLSWSSIVPNLLYPSNTIHGILPVQFMHLTVFFHNLSPSFLWSTSWQLPWNQIWCKSVHGGFWANVWNITKILCIYLHPLLLGTHQQVKPVGRFSRLMAQMTQTHARMCLFWLSCVLLSI